LLAITTAGVVIILLSVLLSMFPTQGSSRHGTGHDGHPVDAGGQPEHASLQWAGFSPRSIGIFCAVFGSLSFFLLSELGYSLVGSLTAGGLAGLIAVALLARWQRRWIRIIAQLESKAGPGPQSPPPLIGQRAEVILPIPAYDQGGAGQIRLAIDHRTQSARTRGDSPLAQGSKVSVIAEDSYFLWVAPDNEP